MSMTDLSKLQSPNALDRFLSASKEQLTPAQYEEAVAFFADLSSDFTGWLTEATAFFLRARHVGEEALQRMKQQVEESELADKYHEQVEQSKAAEKADAEASSELASIVIDDVSGVYSSQPKSVAEQEADYQKALERGQAALGDIPYVDDFGIVDGDLEVSLQGVRLLRPQALAASASDDIIKAIFPEQQTSLQLEISEEEFEQMLKRVAALAPVLSAEAVKSDTWQAVLQDSNPFLEEANGAIDVFENNLCKFPLFFYKALHLWLWCQEQNSATEEDITAVKGQLLYLQRLYMAVELFLGFTVAVISEQLHWLQTVQRYEQEGLLQNLPRKSHVSAKTKKANRKKAKQSRAANRKRRH